MTWGEFKATVEAAGVKDDDTLGYIDVESHHFEVVKVERYESTLTPGETRFTIESGVRTSAR